MYKMTQFQGDKKINLMTPPSRMGGEAETVLRVSARKPPMSNARLGPRHHGEQFAAAPE
jgi:hypothetical protein